MHLRLRVACLEVARNLLEDIPILRRLRHDAHRAVEPGQGVHFAGGAYDMPEASRTAQETLHLVINRIAYNDSGHARRGSLLYD